MPIALAAALMMAPAPTAAADIPARILSVHNAERTRLDIAPLVWDEALARDAAVWARELVAKRRFEHSQQRGGQGENLWMGTSGAYPVEFMIGRFVAERRQFRPGRFPDVARSGNWAEVGHYTQLIWPSTQKVGCALASGGGQDVLVCRYWPAGNVMGQQVP